MRTWILSLLVLLSGCAQLGSPVSDTKVAALLKDAAFAPSTQAVDADDLFTLSPAMQRHVRSPQFQATLREHGPVMGLLHALYDPRDLKLDYDATYTGTASETYAARKGNCLSLVIMTAAFARELGMTVRYQEVKVEETWNRERATYLVSSHVNLSLAPSARRFHDQDPESMLTIDFIPELGASRNRVTFLDETEIIALYMNNRAAEELVLGNNAQAYWWARAALLKNPELASAYNTLAVIYQRSGQPLMAEQVFRVALEREPDSLIVMQNLAPVLAANGKQAEAEAMTQRVARLYPAPPYHYFEQGMKAYQAGKFEQARKLFAREVARAPYNDEFHFWLGLANLQLGELTTAEKQLTLARENSVRSDTRERYAAKLAHLRGMTNAPRRN
ncbi:tetratricopeptide repeat protein [Massilia sp. Mn16-1_5]|uniref:tetratricopeptide repeat protein n=1 Tax=Massilia sp. Mn16-1_5 TaxID=2079199 RepID=UPI001E3B4163|nr:tetratricopeptide repeat protein [Massilia sp. Mn16-1_5]